LQGGLKMRKEIQGRQGKSVILDDKTVIIVKKGGLLSAKREKTLPIRNISSVEVKKPGMAFAGYIQFSIAGGQSLNSSYKVSGGTLDAVKDENSVVFADVKSYNTAMEIKSYIESYSETSSTVINQSSGADEIIKFKKLLDNGVISKEEFESKKKQLLGM
jgi:hypothetical protein